MLRGVLSLQENDALSLNKRFILNASPVQGSLSRADRVRKLQGNILVGLGLYSRFKKAFARLKWKNILKKFKKWPKNVPQKDPSLLSDDELELLEEFIEKENWNDGSYQRTSQDDFQDDGEISKYDISGKIKNSPKAQIGNLQDEFDLPLLDPVSDEEDSFWDDDSFVNSGQYYMDDVNSLQDLENDGFWVDFDNLFFGREKDKFKTVDDKDKFKTVDDKDKFKTVDDKDKLNTVDDKEKPKKTVDDKDKFNTVDDKDKLKKTVDDKEKLKTMVEKDKLKKTVDDKEKLKTVDDKDKFKTVDDKDKLKKTVDDKEKLKTMVEKDKFKTVDDKDKLKKTVDDKDKLKTVDDKEKPKKNSSKSKVVESPKTDLKKEETQYVSPKKSSKKRKARGAHELRKSKAEPLEVIKKSKEGSFPKETNEVSDSTTGQTSRNNVKNEISSNKALKIPLGDSESVSLPGEFTIEDKIVHSGSLPASEIGEQIQQSSSLGSNKHQKFLDVIASLEQDFLDIGSTLGQNLVDQHFSFGDMSHGSGNLQTNLDGINRPINGDFTQNSPSTRIPNSPRTEVNLGNDPWIPVRPNLNLGRGEETDSNLNGNDAQSLGTDENGAANTNPDSDNNRSTRFGNHNGENTPIEDNNISMNGINSFDNLNPGDHQPLQNPHENGDNLSHSDLSDISVMNKNSDSTIHPNNIDDGNDYSNTKKIDYLDSLKEDPKSIQTNNDHFRKQHSKNENSKASGISFAIIVAGALVGVILSLEYSKALSAKPFIDKDFDQDFEVVIDQSKMDDITAEFYTFNAGLELQDFEIEIDQSTQD